MDYETDDNVLAAADAIARQTGVAAILPDPDPFRRNPWQRVNPCPCCGERWCAVINYQTGWFYCHHCLLKVSWRRVRRVIQLSGQGGEAGEDHVWSVEDNSTHWITRFRDQIDTAARKAARRFHNLDTETARDYAQWRICVYAKMMSPDKVDHGPGDWGKLFTWGDEIAAKTADPAERENQLDRYVAAALNADLLDYGKHRLSAHYVKNADGFYLPRERSLDEILSTPGGDDEGSAADEFLYRHPTLFEGMELEQTPEEQVLAAVPGLEIPWDEWPYLAARYRDELTFGDIAVKFGCSKSTARARVNRELERVQAIVKCQRRERSGPPDPFRPNIWVG